MVCVHATSFPSLIRPFLLSIVTGVQGRRDQVRVYALPAQPGYEGGGSGRSHPENADPDQQVAKKDEAKYTLLVEWTNQQK